MQRQDRFSLLKFFSTISFIAILAIGVATIYFARETLVRQLVDAGQAANVALAKSFANAMWEDSVSLVTDATETENEALVARPETDMLHRRILSLVDGLPVLKVKIYNNDALTVYSSEFAQMGESKSSNAGYLKAAGEGVPVSKISRRGSFSAFSGQVSDVSLVETYVPIFKEDGTSVEETFELYSDVTELTEQIDGAVLKLAIIIGLLFLLLYAILFIAISKANRTIRGQSERLEQSKENLEMTNVAMMREIAAREKVEKELKNDVIERRSPAVLPKVKQMCKEISSLYIEVAGPGHVDDIREVFKQWSANETHGPGSVPIFIGLLGVRLDAEKRRQFEAKARDLIRV